ncbi:MAG: hypothetical protein NTV07_01555 [Candidatus Omnitrophica bacterium]|nr:hypothetical protein [Candidatus Omnitrophota bacterium]
MKPCKFSIYIALISIAAVALSGCVSAPSRRSSGSSGIAQVEKPLNVSANLKFEDVPIPDGFSILRDQSFVFQNASLRVGMMRYAGRATAEQVMVFFKTQMAIYNWELQNVVEHVISEMYFSKADETCIIAIEPLTTKTIINVAVSPKAGTFSTGLGLGKGKF